MHPDLFARKAPRLPALIDAPAYLPGYSLELVMDGETGEALAFSRAVAPR